jgi:quinoprotein dehydrogenase-associated probable ABC transporter substrate-binding protein
MKRKVARLMLAALALGGAAAGSATAQMAAPGADGVLRICADPNNPPLSKRDGSGFENRIAALMAQDFGLKLEYTWFPQRMGFIRNTLRAREPDADRYKCDVVMGVPVGFELAAATRPYYHSTWAMVVPKGKGLDAIRVPDDLLQLPPEKLKSLHFGLIARSPPTDWLLSHHLIDQTTGYAPQTGDPDAYPGEIIEKELAAGHVDVAFAWGPMAGYFAKNAAQPMTVVPFPVGGEVRYDFEIAIGVRQGDKDWLGRIDRFIEKNQAKIDAILASYGVPLLDAAGKVVAVQLAQ